MQAAFEREACEYWLDALAKRRIPAAPVNDIAQALNDPQVPVRNMRVSVRLPSGEVVEQPGNPVKLSMTGGEAFTPPPRLGEHTQAVLASIGIAPNRIRELAEEGVIQTADASEGGACQPRLGSGVGSRST